MLGTPPEAPKTKALRDGTKVAVSIDTDTMPYNVLQIRGSVRTDVVDGIVPEYEAMTLRSLGEEAGRAWLEIMQPICPRMMILVALGRSALLTRARYGPGASRAFATGRPGWLITASE